MFQERVLHQLLRIVGVARDEVQARYRRSCTSRNSSSKSRGLTGGSRSACRSKEQVLPCMRPWMLGDPDSLTTVCQMRSAFGGWGPSGAGAPSPLVDRELGLFTRSVMYLHRPPSAVGPSGIALLGQTGGDRALGCALPPQPQSERDRLLLPLYRFQTPLIPDLRFHLWALEDSNLRPLACKASALPLS